MMSMLTDFHSHILPQVDDGSSSIEESLALLRMEAEQGIERVVATPHFYANYDNPERFLKRRNESAMRLAEKLEKQGNFPQLSLGAEVYFFPGMSNSKVLRELTVDGSKYIMVEMPRSPWTKAMYRELEDIYVKQGLVPIIAHVDRYIRPLQTYSIPENLSKLPVLVQANASFFLGFYTKHMALRLLKENKIHLLGSDCHNILDRKPNLGEAISYIKDNSSVKLLNKIKFYEHKVLTDDIFLLE